MNKLNAGRLLIISGFLVGLISWSLTVSHIGNPGYILVPGFEGGETHTWHHAFREAIGDLAAMAVILYIFFGAPANRTRITWWVCLILMLGYYLPFWIGTPFMPELAAPHWKAELVHIFMAVLPVSGLIFAREIFIKNDDAL